MGDVHDKAYDDLLNRKVKLVYGEALSLGGKHKEMTELLDVYEVQLFIEVGKAVNGFMGHAELSTLKLLLWNIFGVHLMDVYPYTEDYYKFQKKREKGRVWREALEQVLIKLTCKCVDEDGNGNVRMVRLECPRKMCFLNRHPKTRSGIEINHLNTRKDNQDLKGFGESKGNSIKDYTTQLKKGRGDVICVLCHEEKYTNPK